MYISLGLLYLCFKIIHGEIIRCPLGGIANDEELCESLSKESVLNKYYLFGLVKEITVNKENKYDIHDKPYYSFKGSTEKTAVTPKLNTLDAMRTFSNGTGQAERLDSDYQILRKKIFKQSLIVDENNEIGKVWNETLSLGTDTYIIKFHNKLLTKYKGTELTIPFRDYMVFIQSYYNAASIYYFSRKYKKAFNVIKEGAEFSRKVSNARFKTDHSIDKGQFNVWSWLFVLLEQDISKKIPEITLGNIFKLSDINKMLNDLKLKIENPVFPSSVVLFYRRYFLNDQIIENKTKEVLKDWAKQIDINSIDKDIMYTKNISMYSFLVFFSFREKYEDRLENILKAIQLPVLSVEDRLLNYKANQLAEEFISFCLDDSELSFLMPCYPIIQKQMQQNKVLKTTVFPKLKNVYYFSKNNKYIIENLFENILNPSTGISERILHVIVTAATEIVDTSSTKYKKNIKNIKEAIEILTHYVKGQTEKRGGNNKPIENDKSIDDETIDTEDINDTDLKKNKLAKMAKIYNITYSLPMDKMRNMFIASKWLAELNGALCNSEQDYQKELKLYIEIADMSFKSLSEFQGRKDDDHLNYLKNKQDAKIILANNSFEVLSWPGGWHFSNSNTEISAQSKVFNELNSLRNSDCPYINKIELNILLYRLYIVMNTVKSEYNQMYSYIKSAVDNVVVTAEDRARNLEAHELFSMFLMMRNRNAIEKGCNTKNSQDIYNKFLKLPPSN